MTVRTLPRAFSARPQHHVEFDLAPLALERWNRGLRAAGKSDNTIQIFDEIGADPMFGEGVTLRAIDAELRSIDGRDVTVDINSPGGDMFEGLAIYNLLREHKGKVTVRILGLAASAASVIAMAGDEIQISRSGFLMIHNAWAVVMGNRNDLRSFADTLEPFDRSMAEVYAARSGNDPKTIATLMDQETWIDGTGAVADGFADALLASDQVDEKQAPRSHAQVIRDIEAALRKAGMSRAQSKQIIHTLSTIETTAEMDDITHVAAEAATLEILNNFSLKD